MTRSDLLRVIGIAFTVIVCLAGVAVGVLALAADRSDGKARRDLLAGCAIADRRSAWERRGEVDLTHQPDGPRDAGVANAILPIRDCPTGERLDRAQERRFIAVSIVLCREPVVKDGRVLGAGESLVPPGGRQCPRIAAEDIAPDVREFVDTAAQ